MNLQGRTILITGGSRGLGLAIARQCVSRGAKVAICARDRDELNAAQDDLRHFGGQAEGFTCDLTDDPIGDQTSRLAAELES